MPSFAAASASWVARSISPAVAYDPEASRLAAEREARQGQMAWRWVDGWPVWAIAQAVGCTPATVYSELRVWYKHRPHDERSHDAATRTARRPTWTESGTAARRFCEKRQKGRQPGVCSGSG